MSLCVVVGGQFGSEGKGKIAASISLSNDIDAAVRCGGPNSGHSFVSQGREFLVRQLPTAFVNPKTRLLIPAGAIVDLRILRDELVSLGVRSERIGVDRNAMIIEDVDKAEESALRLGERLSSTLCGVGAAAARRIMRTPGVRLAKDAAQTDGWLAPLLTDVSKETNEMLDRNKNVLVEGTQGFGLSVFHSDSYPKTTSKDTSASAFLSEVGISPLRVSDVVLVLRTFPIRVAGVQAGPLCDEVTWELIQSESRYPYAIHEFTTVTKKQRRVGRFDWQLARKAVDVNRPTRLAINCVDHIAFEDRGVTNYEALTADAKAFLRKIDEELNTPVGFLGTGPSLDDVIILNGHESNRRRAQPSLLAS
jgi:adenylosuccinate synthase